MPSTQRHNSYSSKCVVRYDYTMAFPHLGLDLIGPINPPSNGHIWILVATEYFTKWVETIPLKKATGAAVVNFIWEHNITRFGIPRRLISNNGNPFINRDIKNLIESYHIKHGRSTPYCP